MFEYVYSRLRGVLLAIGCAFVCQCLVLFPGPSRATTIFGTAGTPSSLSLTRLKFEGPVGFFRFHKIGATLLAGATSGIHRDSTHTMLSDDDSREWWAERNWAFDGTPLVHLHPHSMQSRAKHWLRDFLAPFRVADEVLVVTIPEQTTGLLLSLGVAGIAATTRTRRLVFRHGHPACGPVIKSIVQTTV